MDTTKVITATELKTNLGKYLDYVAENNEVVITKNGNKFVRLTPYLTDIERYFTVKERSLDYQYGGKKVSYEEFMEIYEKSDLRMEFINGEIVLLASPNTFHQDIAGNLHVILRSFLKGGACKVFFAPFDVHFFKKDFDTPDVMQPDLLIACDTEKTVNEKGRYMGTPELCIEILSKSTRTKDMVDKLNTFMLSGVKEFWIVDPDKRTVIVYGFQDCSIEEYMSYKEGDILQSVTFKALRIPVGDIFES
ncbi:type II toxin-antitoxin system Phd/YefM family antitoxin [Paenibacillus sp. HB172176]|uniref:type II toxin-antitoxin system Phd/YefM family antitoxin n=1 Tax=Paenibacillus sp. HB172176 TaxID=2493690 RepID=UPI00143AA488|nr:type II toxin-antitoxin system Phd/YefM family antitoxin [Paenibacillus sp. HB172176]